jgi:hypothetical protein
MTRAEHLQWCKDRALEYVSRDDLEGAYISMISNLLEHNETRDIGSRFGMDLMFIAELSTSEKMKKFIEGFN